MGGGQVPYVTREIAVDSGTYEGEPAVRERELTRWEVHRILEAGVSFPFNRVRRVEFTGGYRNVDYDAELKTSIYSDITGNLLLEETTGAGGDSLPSLNMGTVSAALVYDNAHFGGTSPLLGQRYRLEVGPTFGNLRFLSVLADYRRYHPIRFPLVFAARAVHIGRYGSGSEDLRLTELFLGYPWLIRGYDDGSFTFAEATPDPDDPGATPLYAQLFGSKMAFANFELRLPLLGAFGVVPSAGVPPVEAHGFFDAGVAWTEDQQARFLGGPRRLLRSYGVGLRVNLLGIAIGELDYVKPLDRPYKGAYWVFTLSPGF
jgi:outer membrane protein assembly factor BamA